MFSGFDFSLSFHPSVMGCVSSKQQRVCQNCRGPFSPATRSYSMHVHHPPEWLGDNYHVVALTDSTLGSIKLDSVDYEFEPPVDDGDERKLSGSMAVMEARTWSEMLEKKIPKSIPRTPIRTPPGEPESIDVWELMEGLEETSPLRPTNRYRSFSFNVGESAKLPHPESNPLWLEMAESESNSNSISDSNSTSLTSVISETNPEMHEEEDLPSSENPLDEEFEHVNKNYSKERMTLYFTSLRGVRKTYEDCCHVRSILKSLGIRVDERDVSMHSSFKEELKELSANEGLKGMMLPRVFIGKKYIGDAEEIRRLHDEGELEKTVGSCEPMGEEEGCEACGDVRFLPCERCSGSCKIIYHNDDEDDENGFQKCPDCNENGLIRCPICCN